MSHISTISTSHHRPSLSTSGPLLCNIIGGCFLWLGTAFVGMLWLWNANALKGETCSFRSSHLAVTKRFVLKTLGENSGTKRRFHMIVSRGFTCIFCLPSFFHELFMMFMIHSQSGRSTSFDSYLLGSHTCYKLQAGKRRFCQNCQILWFTHNIFCFQGMMNLYLSNKFTPMHYTSIWNSKVWIWALTA